MYRARKILRRIVYDAFADDSLRELPPPRIGSLTCRLLKIIKQPKQVPRGVSCEVKQVTINIDERWLAAAPTSEFDAWAGR